MVERSYGNQMDSQRHHVPALHPRGRVTILSLALPHNYWWLVWKGQNSGVLHIRIVAISNHDGGKLVNQRRNQLLGAFW